MKLKRWVKNLLSGNWFEIAHPGKYNGRVFTLEDLHEMAAMFDPEFRAAPIVIGHPDWLGIGGEDPAHGEITGLRVVGEWLLATAGNLSDELRAGLESGKWINRSLEAFPVNIERHDASHADENGKLYLTALAVLGHSQPAIPTMLSNEQKVYCIDTGDAESDDAPESKSPEIEKHESTPTNNKGASKMDATELKRLEDVEKKLDAQAGEFKTLQSSLTALTDSVTKLSTSIGEFTKLKTDYDALSASTTALVDAQAQLAVNEATKGIPKALCPDEKKASLLSLYKTDRKAFDVEKAIFASMRDKFGYLTKEVVTEEGTEQSEEVAGLEFTKGKDATESKRSKRMMEILAKAKKDGIELSEDDALIQAYREVKD